MTLAQFATNYRPLRVLPKDIGLICCQEGGMISEELSDICIWTTEAKLPIILKLKNNMGYVKLRNHQIVLRIHASKKKGGHEEFFSEMLLFSPWNDERKDLYPNDGNKCYEEYLKRYEFITSIKKIVFPGDKAVDILSCDFHQEFRPQHAYDQLNCQTEQENEDQSEEIVEEDLDIAPIHYHGEKSEDLQMSIKEKDMCRYKKIPYMEKEALMSLTLNLVPEQKEVLTKFLNYCKDIIKAQKKPHLSSKPLLLLVHGGAGNYIEI